MYNHRNSSSLVALVLAGVAACTTQFGSPIQQATLKVLPGAERLTYYVIRRDEAAAQFGAEVGDVPVSPQRKTFLASKAQLETDGVPFSFSVGLYVVVAQCKDFYRLRSAPVAVGNVTELTLDCKKR